MQHQSLGETLRAAYQRYVSRPKGLEAIGAASGPARAMAGPPQRGRGRGVDERDARVPPCATGANAAPVRGRPLRVASKAQGKTIQHYTLQHHMTSRTKKPQPQRGALIE